MGLSGTRPGVCCLLGNVIGVYESHAAWLVRAGAHGSVSRMFRFPLPVWTLEDIARHASTVARFSACVCEAGEAGRVCVVEGGVAGWRVQNSGRAPT